MKLTEVEKNILKNTLSWYRYIVRDYDGNLYIYEHKPIKNEYFWDRKNIIMSSFAILKAFNHLFQDVKWTDDEPLEFRDNTREFIL